MQHLYTHHLLLALTLSTTATVALAQPPCPATDGLTTLYAQTNGLDGVMFDVVALEDITVDCFEANWTTGTTSFAMWYKAGTHVGSEQTPADWTSIGAVAGVVTAGEDLPTYIPLTVNVAIPSGSTYAFYITNNVNTDPNAKYTDGTTLGAVLASDANLQVLEGSGVSFQFGASVFAPRQFNGTVYYTVGGVGVEELPSAPLTLFPNPASDRVSLDLSAQSGIYRLRVFDLSGREVLAQQGSAGMRIHLDLSQLPAGTYALQLLSDEGARIMPLVKQ